MLPIDRACLQYAVQVVWALDHSYVSPEGDYLFISRMHRLDPSADVRDAVIAALAQMMKLHLGGSSLAELRNDLLRSNVGEQFANRVHDHLADVSCEEWAALRARVSWYAEDTGAHLNVSTEDEGVS